MKPVHIKSAGPSRVRRIDLNLLELFEAIYDHRNLTNAAAHLGLTQPAVSRGLGRLRDAYGDPLLVRQQRGVLPTPFAEQLSGQVSAALERARATFAAPTFDPASQARRFRVAMSDVGERIFLPRSLGHLQRQAPHASIDVVSPTTSQQLQDDLGARRIDLGAGFFGKLSGQVRQQRLFHEKLIYVVRNAHPYVKGHLRREELRYLSRVIGGPEGMQHMHVVEKVLCGKRINAPIALRVHSLLCVGPVVAESDLVGLVPSNLAAVVAGDVPLQRIEPPMRIPGFEVTMVWHERFHRDPASVWPRPTFPRVFAADA